MSKINPDDKFRTINRFYRSLLCLLLLLLLAGCKASEDVAPPLVEPKLITLDIDLPATVDNFAQDLTFDPETAQYFDLVHAAMLLNDEEMDLLTQNGFVVTDRLNWTRFVEAYAWIYKNDLPVIVTSDSILHAVHQSYSNLLQELESNVIHPELVKMLVATRAQVQAEAKTVSDDSLAALYQDVSDYLTVAIILARGEALRTINGDPYLEAVRVIGASYDVTLDLTLLSAYNSKRINELVQLAWNADTAMDLNNDNGVALTLFNNPRSVDFTLFQPRAHYNSTLLLGNYFRAVTWLAQVDFRFVEFNPKTSEPSLNQDSVAAAKILQEAIDGAEQRQRWSEINAVFEYLVGRSDNTTLPDFDQLSADMGWDSPADVMQADSAQLLTQLLSKDYGQQRITGQLIGRHVQNSTDEAIPRPISFMLMGQRFSLDSWAMGNVVYDRLFHDGQPIERALPTGFDVMVSLGNDHAITHLQAELEQYPYEATLATLRQRIGGLDASYWQAPVYNQWLGMIRSLNAPTVANNYPSPMQTRAWADKNLQTQLSSWAQLRHDNILYVKQSYTTGRILCEFPSVFVEPYPALYQALYEFAQNGQALISLIDKNFPNESEQLQTYFTDVAESAQLLTIISEKELAQTPLSEAERTFLESLVIKQDYSPGCGGPTFEEMWDGWYMHMIYGKDETPAIIADVHTNPTNDPGSALYPPRVLHVGTGPAVALFMIVDLGDGPALHVGPAFAYFEFAEEGFPPVRLNDQQWREMLTQEDTAPGAPTWVASFRIPVDVPAEPFEIPSH